MRVAVVTDSSARLGPESPPAVRLVPITVALADRELADHRIDVSEVCAALGRGEPVKSRPPTAMAYFSAIEAGAADAAVVLTPAQEFTPMRELAELAASMAWRPTVVVDTRTAAAAQGLVVEAAARVAEAGAELADVVAEADAAAGRAELVAALSQTGTLAGQGWLPALSWSGRRHGVRLFRLAEGRITPVGQAAADEVIEALTEEYRRLGGPGAGAGAGDVVAFHAGPRRLADRLAATVGARRPPAVFSPAMTAHTGAGLVGLAWLRPS